MFDKNRIDFEPQLGHVMESESNTLLSGLGQLLILSESQCHHLGHKEAGQGHLQDFFASLSSAFFLLPSSEREKVCSYTMEAGDEAEVKRNHPFARRQGF